MGVIRLGWMTYLAVMQRSPSWEKVGACPELVEGMGVNPNPHYPNPPIIKTPFIIPHILPDKIELEGH